ncbi:hypothetical protein CJ030_MR6G021500 [Morella rubra]|uniref:GTD-binding domain-containing protein n=1 Tax=Morella rubra TaxID=262757 RepID=A0A6A1VAA8_9ROSI|nr:hypothetical protein CJ030_MR7G013043 [Morella rubra]KAB1211310.1 hypothetical protein CJ030_MR6G021500 [Morella rubra]
MATNKFATMLYRKTPKIVVVLVYAVLEWVLIILLLLNSLFSYSIRKFSSYFGLKPPCLWCSRVDHIFEPGKNKNCYRDLVCDMHAAEISKLSYCSAHQNLAEQQDMCDDCLASRPSFSDSSLGSTQRFAFISWVGENRIENDEKIFRCSCCNESLSCKLYPPLWLLKPSLDALNDTQNDSLVIEAVDDDNSERSYKEPGKSDSQSSHRENENPIHPKRGEENCVDEGIADKHQILYDVGGYGFKEIGQEDYSMALKDSIEQDLNGTSFVNQYFHSTTNHCWPGQDKSLELINGHFMSSIASEFNRLIPVELIDSSTTANQGSCNLKDEEDLRECDHQNRASDTEARSEIQLIDLKEAGLTRINESSGRESEGQLKSLEFAEGYIDNSATVEVVERKQDMVSEACRQVAATQESPTSFINGEAETKEPDEPPAKTVTGTEASNNAADQPQAEEPISSLSYQQEDKSSTNDDGAVVSTAPGAFVVQNELDPKPMGATLQEKTTSKGQTQEGINNHVSIRSEPNEAEEDKYPDTPTSVDSLHYLHKKLQLPEKRESGAEESLDGSVVSEMEGGDAVSTIELLKAALKAERKALCALYAELEEERSASAISANQTMAMITRLQEEKAAMQMEALQYQRMMEEQAEYDQEALQLLNEIMIKREKEKQELEKELEIYQKKVSDYEAKEKKKMMRRVKNESVRSRNSSVSGSNVDESDELSIDLNREARDEDRSYSGHQDSSQNNSPDGAVLNLEEMALDCVKHMSALDESLTEFEEERLSILDQLKALEERLITLGDDEGLLEDGKSLENSSVYCVEELDDQDFTSPEENGISTGFSKDKVDLERKTTSLMAKRLLPLLDATNNDNEDLLFEAKGESEYIEVQNSLESSSELEGKKVAIEDEVDHVYERLQALEADREFLKHCMSSIKKGDKGVDLLQEILQHLRDLRAVETRVKNMSDDHLE